MSIAGTRRFVLISCVVFLGCSGGATSVELVPDLLVDDVADVVEVRGDLALDFLARADEEHRGLLDGTGDGGGEDVEMVPDGGVAGTFGWPCDDNEDCQSGFCLATAEGQVCTQTCFDECPDGFECLQWPYSGPDVLYLCIPEHMHLCRPCLDHAACRVSIINTGDMCVDYGPAGYFCGGQCEIDAECPSGYQCLEVPLVDGGTAFQCVPVDGGQCSCSWLATVEAAKTVCHVSSEAGTCWGDRQCGDGGLTECDAQEPGAEHCDGLDNDCDGDVDEELGETQCGLGPCEHTIANCADGSVQECDPLLGAAPEICDGLDNDCDGLVDEELGETSCGLGVCLKTVANCSDGKNVNCNPFEGAAAEVCDGVDNDCDGLTDEEQGQLTCGLGLCVHTLPACKDGESQVCDPLADAAEEICDGFDNDCNGLVDEELGQSSCGLGICDHTISNCVAGEEQICDPLAGAKSEVCDGNDNDCDGETDEGLGVSSCGNGVCAHTVANCEGGIIQVCNPFDGAGAEVCDGQDNDCDGLQDEELGQLTCGLGVCSHTVSACVDGVPQVCDPLAGAAPEICDGMDNDCDGDTDEEQGQLACGLGECFHIIPACDDGEPQLCDPLEGALGEACNGIDDDCNGDVDEGFDDTNADGEADCVDTDDDGDGDLDENDCAPLDKEVHHGAQEVCGNAIDDDCDGVSDNDCAVLSCLARLQAVPGSPSGVYTIDADGNGPLAPFKTWCDMETDGGGWTYGAIVNTTTSSANRTRVAGLTAFGSAQANKLANEFSVNLTGISFGEVRIDNFTKPSAVVRSTAAPLVWDGTTYQGGGSLPAKRMSLASSWELRLGYYIAYCSLETTNIPICFTPSSNPLSWVCDTDSGPVEGWVDPTGGELCGLHYCKKVWRDSACTSYVGSTAVYGLAVR